MVFPHAVGGTGDHVHVFAGLRATHGLASVMRELKSESSASIKKKPGLHGFTWQEGCGAFTVSASSPDPVRDYVLNQEAHHRKTTFQQEYVAMLRRGLVEYDERYLWWPPVLSRAPPADPGAVSRFSPAHKRDSLTDPREDGFPACRECFSQRPNAFMTQRWTRAWVCT